MRTLQTAVGIFALTLFSAVGVAADAQSILRTALQKQAERWEGVDTYVIVQSSAGFSTSTTMKRTTVKDDGGNAYPMFVPSGTAAAGPDGVPESATRSTWAGIDPRALDESANDAGTGVDAQDMADSMNTFIRTAKLVGSDSIDGRDAYHLKSDAIDIVEQMQNEELRVETMSMWMDEDRYVPLKMTMQGTISSAGHSRPVQIETLMTDYRNVPGSNMYESYRRVVRMGGVLNDEQKGQMAEARQQLAEFEKQLADMPPSQRQMMESMMGSQLEQFRKMAAGDGMEFETVVTEIRVNP